MFRPTGRYRQADQRELEMDGSLYIGEDATTRGEIFPSLLAHHHAVCNHQGLRITIAGSNIADEALEPVIL